MLRILRGLPAIYIYLPLKKVEPKAKLINSIFLYFIIKSGISYFAFASLKLFLKVDYKGG